MSIFLSGFWQDGTVVNALIVGSIAAVLSATLGYFVVVRGLSFIGHAVTDIGLTGATGAILIGISPLWGLLAFSIAAALGVDLLGDRARERDVATGVILALALGIGSLFLYFGTHFANEPFVLLFGSIFSADPAATPLILLIGCGCLIVLAFLFRPLLFASITLDVARARGVRVRIVGLVFIATMAVGVAEAAQVVGVLLSTALLIGPAASAAYITARPGLTIALAILLGLLETWMGIVLAYDSFTWPGGHAWPVSFFITTLTLGMYIVCRMFRPVDRRHAGRTTVQLAVAA